MSNYKSITPRNNVKNIVELMTNYYKCHLDDVILLNPNKDILVGITGINKNIPILQMLFVKESFLNCSSTFCF